MKNNKYVMEVLYEIRWIYKVILYRHSWSSKRKMKESWMEDKGKYFFFFKIACPSLKMHRNYIRNSHLWNSETHVITYFALVNCSKIFSSLFSDSLSEDDMRFFSPHCAPKIKLCWRSLARPTKKVKILVQKKNNVKLR